MRAHYSGLEVVPNDADGPGVVNKPEGKIVVRSEQESDGYKVLVGHDASHFEEEVIKPEYEDLPKQRPTLRFCGLEVGKRSVYGLLILLLVLIVAAAVGGGVGGALGSQNDKSSNNAPADSSATANSTSPATPTSSMPITTTTIIYQSETEYRDCPSSNNSIYSVSQEGDAEPSLWRKLCSHVLLGPTAPDEANYAGVYVNSPTNSLNDCIDLCAKQNTINASSIASNTMQPCNAVCWRNGAPGDIYPFHCYGFLYTNESNAFRSSNDTLCDTAAWINQS